MAVWYGSLVEITKVNGDSRLRVSFLLLGTMKHLRSTMYSLWILLRVSLPISVAAANLSITLFRLIIWHFSFLLEKLEHTE